MFNVQEMLGGPARFLQMEDYMKPMFGQDTDNDVKQELAVECSIKPVGLCAPCQSYYDQNGFLSPNEACPGCLKRVESLDRRPTCSTCSMETCVCPGFQCAYCNQSFQTTFLLQKHTFVHCTDTTMSSSICTINENNKDPQCPRCQKCYKQFEPSRHNCSSRFICHICGSGLSSAYNLRIHLMKHSGELPHKCETCGKSFSKPSELLRHTRVHTGIKAASRPGLKIYPCEVCSKSFGRPADLRRHALTHSGSRPFACTVCGLAFSDTSNLKKHITTHLKGGAAELQAKTYHCSYCNKLFSRPSELKRHYTTHTKNRPFSCDFCGLAFSDTSNLRKHVLGHARLGLRDCVMCSASFESFEELESHVVTHRKSTEDRIMDCVRCDICGKIFSSELYLSGHRAGHTESRPYSCSECHKTFKSLSHLKNHHLTHTGARGQVCNTCGKAFLTKSSLRRHEGIHTRQNPNNVQQQQQQQQQQHHQPQQHQQQQHQPQQPQQQPPQQPSPVVLGLAMCHEANTGPHRTTPIDHRSPLSHRPTIEPPQPPPTLQQIDHRTIDLRASVEHRTIDLRSPIEHRGDITSC